MLYGINNTVKYQHSTWCLKFNQSNFTYHTLMLSMLFSVALKRNSLYTFYIGIVIFHIFWTNITNLRNQINEYIRFKITRHWPRRIYIILKTILCVKRPRRQFKSTKTHDIFKPKRNIQSFRLVGLVYDIEIMNIV